MKVKDENKDLIVFTHQQMHMNKSLVDRLVNVESKLNQLEGRQFRFSRWLLIILFADILYFMSKLFIHYWYNTNG